nr:MAG TPA: Protein of unknown function (DUF3102) [Caudoviricetes sp.]
MDVITYQKTYREYKAELDSELQKTAEGFVRIGYLLKVARDTNVLAESGYKTVAEFAQAEYSLDKTQVSRFISINDKFAEGGYSERLQAKYQGFGYAKLTLMLQLPDAVNEALTPSYSKAEIQSIKEEVDEEKKVSDIEVCLEASQAPEEGGTLIERIVRQLLHDEPGMFIELHREALGCSMNMQHFQRIMAPAGEKTYSVRLAGVGRILLILNDGSDNRAVNSRTGEFEEVTWQQLRDAVEKLTGFKECTGKTAEDRWSELFGEPYPLNAPEAKSEVAPEQQTKQPAVRKESKVQKARTESPKKPVNPKTEEEKAVEQIPGQVDISDFPEYMPETVHKDGCENTEKPINTQCGGHNLIGEVNAPVEVVNTPETENGTGAESKEHKTADKTAILNLLDEIKAAVTADHWGTAMVKEHSLRELIDRAAHGGTDEVETGEV